MPNAPCRCSSLGLMCNQASLQKALLRQMALGWTWNAHRKPLRWGRGVAVTLNPKLYNPWGWGGA
eukprot:100718-Chlamydomonas_euryale.AAC.2